MDGQGADGAAEGWVTQQRAMYDFFTDRARKVMALAHQEAQRFNHEYVGPEHILLGLMKEGSGVAANVLKNLNVDLRKLRLEVERIVGSGPSMSDVGKLPLTDQCKRVLDYAADESRAQRVHYIGTEHLLLGLIREPDGPAPAALKAAGVNLAELRDDISTLLGKVSAAESPPASAADVSPAEQRFADHPLVKKYRALHQQLLRERDEAVTRTQYELAAFHRDAAAAIETLLARIVKFLEDHPDAGRDEFGTK